MESEQEWQFMKNEIQNQKTDSLYKEWFIGLKKKLNYPEMDLDQW